METLNTRNINGISIIPFLISQTMTLFLFLHNSMVLCALAHTPTPSIQGHLIYPQPNQPHQRHTTETGIYIPALRYC
ncbi:hypothetical protein K469DRAFT_233916 [Zopfia rhizophila CBS 207.26]|uniref:Uncharacterized protein n=1 Tax=Zopfia rhizophila CBS 207.26 TaxID=1314779 RepID=A0A6A6DS68_9PEZI|nr:hypothetical protein K469DRAFT_233916 [Zopfia rhizophila CBS 207.26]